MKILGINALFHDPAAALVVDGHTVAAAEEERFSRRKHGKRPVPFSAWELPEVSARWSLEQAGVRPEELDAVTYSFDPELSRPAHEMGLNDPWDPLRLEYARRAPDFLAEALPGLDPARVVFVPHHVAHAASAGRFPAPGQRRPRPRRPWRGRVPPGRPLPRRCFRRAFREDADLALRVLAAGWRIRQGRRTTRHPVRPTDRWVSLRAQRGNADDALMRDLHGPGWWHRAVAPRGSCDPACDPACDTAGRPH